MVIIVIQIQFPRYIATALVIHKQSMINYLEFKYRKIKLEHIVKKFLIKINFNIKLKFYLYIKINH